MKLTKTEINDRRNATNDLFEEEIIRFKDLFETVEANPLNKEQREAIVADEANNSRSG